MQLNDALNLATNVFDVISAAIVLTAAARAFEMGRRFPSRDYRNRAYWMAAFLIVGASVSIAGIGPQANSNGGYLSALVPLAIPFVFFFVYVFIDRNLIVLMDIDFFHRNTARWFDFRRIGYAMMSIGVPLYLIGAVLSSGTSTFESTIGSAIYLGYFVLPAIAVGWAAIALVKSARITPDMTMKKFARLLGIALAVFLVGALSWVPFASLDPQSPLSGAFIPSIMAVLAGYLLYLATMSMSPIGKVSKEVA